MSICFFQVSTRNSVSSDPWCVCSSSQGTFQGYRCDPALSSEKTREFLFLLQSGKTKERRTQVEVEELMWSRKLVARQMQGQQEKMATLAGRE